MRERKRKRPFYWQYIYTRAREREIVEQAYIFSIFNGDYSFSHSLSLSLSLFLYFSLWSLYLRCICYICVSSPHSQARYTLKQGVNLVNFLHYVDLGVLVQLLLFYILMGLAFTKKKAIILLPIINHIEFNKKKEKTYC